MNFCKNCKTKCVYDRLAMKYYSKHFDECCNDRRTTIRTVARGVST